MVVGFSASLCSRYGCFPLGTPQEAGSVCLLGNE